MAQIAQQENLVVELGNINNYLEVTEKAKKQLRRAYIRGTIHDVIIKAKNDAGNAEILSKVVATYEDKDENELYIYIFDSLFDDQMDSIQCGKFQPDDYTDDTPTDEE